MFGRRTERAEAAEQDAQEQRFRATVKGRERVIARGPPRISAIAVTPDASIIVAGHSDGSVSAWDVAGEGSALRWHAAEQRGRGAGVRGIAVSADSRFALSGSGDSNLCLWDLASGEAVWCIPAHKSFVGPVAISDDGRLAVSGGGDNNACVWNVETHACVHSRPCRKRGDLAPVALTPDGRLAASVSRDHTLEVWDAQTGNVVHRYESLLGIEAEPFAISADGTRAIHVYDGMELRVYDTEKPKDVVHKLKGHTETVTSVAMTRRGGVAVSGSADKTVRLWNARSGSGLGTVTTHAKRVTSVAVAHDAMRVVSASEDGNLRLSARLPQLADRAPECKQTIKMAAAPCPGCGTLVAGFATCPGCGVAIASQDVTEKATPAEARPGARGQSQADQP